MEVTLHTYSYISSSCVLTLSETITYTTAGYTDPNTLFLYYTTSRKFTVKQNTDTSTAGSYTITLKVVNPFDSTNFQTMSFKVTVSYCTLTINYAS